MALALGFSHLMVASIIYSIGHYNPSVRIIDLASHTTYVVCANFIHKWRDLQFKVNSERQIFLRHFSWQFYMLSELLPEICWEEIAEELLFVDDFYQKLFMAILYALTAFARNLLRGRMRFWWLASSANPGSTSNKPTHYLLDYGKRLLKVWWNLAASRNIILNGNRISIFPSLVR